MVNKLYSLGLILVMTALVAGCAPAAGPDATMLYATQTVLAQGILDAASTATAYAAVPTETPTPEATPLPTSGSEYQVLEDGSAILTDYEGWYTITIPAGWLGFRPGKAEFYDALAGPALKNKTLQKSLENIQNLNDASYHFFAFDLKPEHANDAFITNLSISVYQDDPLTLEQAIEAVVQDAERNLPGARVLSSGTVENATGQKVGVIGLSYTTSTDLALFNKFALLKTPQGTISMVLTTLSEQRDAIEPDFDAMINSLAAFGQ